MLKSYPGPVESPRGRFQEFDFYEAILGMLWEYKGGQDSPSPHQPIIQGNR